VEKNATRSTNCDTTTGPTRNSEFGRPNWRAGTPVYPNITPTKGLQRMVTGEITGMGHPVRLDLELAQGHTEPPGSVPNLAGQAGR
jgi:hypothetical protein